MKWPHWEDDEGQVGLKKVTREQKQKSSKAYKRVFNSSSSSFTLEEVKGIKIHTCNHLNVLVSSHRLRLNVNRWKKLLQSRRWSKTRRKGPPQSSAPLVSAVHVLAWMRRVDQTVCLVWPWTRKQAVPWGEDAASQWDYLHRCFYAPILGNVTTGVDPNFYLIKSTIGAEPLTSTWGKDRIRRLLQLYLGLQISITSVFHNKLPKSSTFLLYFRGFICTVCITVE